MYVQVCPLSFEIMYLVMSVCMRTLSRLNRLKKDYYKELMCVYCNGPDMTFSYMKILASLPTFYY